jgi:hypothetical protein
MGNKGDIVINGPEISAFTVDQTDLELGHLLNHILPVGGQNVDRQA